VNRRAFLGRFAAGVVGACVVAKVPTALLPASVRRYAACEFLREHYNRWSHGKRKGPAALVVGRELYQAYESEITVCERFTDARDHGPVFVTLNFKAASVVAHPLTGLHGWDVMVLSREQWDVARTRLRAGKPLEWATNAA
jgi:hypothetical protein